MGQFTGRQAACLIGYLYLKAADPLSELDPLLGGWTIKHDYLKDIKPKPAS